MSVRTDFPAEKSHYKQCLNNIYFQIAFYSHTVLNLSYINVHPWYVHVQSFHASNSVCFYPPSNKLHALFGQVLTCVWLPPKEMAY